MKNVAVVVVALFAGTVFAKGETNRQVVEKMLQFADAKTPEKFAEIESADFELKTPMGMLKGPQGHTQMMQQFATAMPNFKHTIKECVESGEAISCEGKFVGDHTGPMMMPDGKTMAASGKHVEFDWVGVAHVKSGKLTSLHVYFNPMDMMMQIGAMPAPSAQGQTKPATKG
jgi:predicted ester cyclase